MIYTALTKKAMALAYQAHHGQLDYNGVPYIFHPIHLAEQMEDEVSCAVALLHDTVEDTYVTPEMLKEQFPDEVVKAVLLLTHSKDEDYFDYVRRIRCHPTARRVKLADLNHNSDQTRCVGANLSEERLQYWKDKYQKAQSILTEQDG